MNEKLAIIMSGGGMRASFNVGVILSLIEKYKITEPFLLICASGSAGTGSYYISKQYDSIRNIWTNLLSSKNFLNPWRFWKIIDIDYLIDMVFKKQDPLDENKVYESKTKYLITALNKKTGKIDYFNNHDNMNVFESMRASKAMPIAFKLNPNVAINDSNYCDSMIPERAKMYTKKAIELGAEKILLIDNLCNNKKYNYENFFFSLWMFFQKCKKPYYKTKKELSNYKIPQNIKTFAISPKSKIKIGTLNNKKELLIEAIEQGYKETTLNNELKVFLNKNHD